MRHLVLLLLLLPGPFAFAQECFDKFAFERMAPCRSHVHAPAPKGMSAGPDRWYDMIYHRMELFVDPAVRYIGGNVTHHFRALDELQELLLDLSDELVVSEVLRQGVPVAFAHNAGSLVVQLVPPVAAGQLDSVTIFYSGEPPSTGFGSFVQEFHQEAPVIWTLSEPYGAKDWWPCKEDLQDKADSLDLIVTTTPGNRVAGNGVLLSETTLSNGNIRFHWKHQFPIAHYLIAFAATNYVVFHTTIELPDVTVPMETWSYPEDSFMMQVNAGDILQQMPFFSELFGTYPFAAEKYGHAQFSWGGGMEHQTMSFMGGFSYELAAHELAHQWFGNKVTCGSWSDIWLNEGFASYLQGLCYDFLAPEYWHGWKAAQIADIVSLPDGSVHVADTLDVARLFSPRLTYRKGAFVLHMLRWIMGDDAFFQGCRAYLDDPELAFASARTSDIQFHLEQASGMDLDQFFTDWIYGEGHPSYLAVWSQDAYGMVSLELSQTPSHPSVSFFKLPVPIGLSNGSLDTVVVLDHEFSGEQFSFHVPFDVTHVAIDPDLWLISGQNTVVSVPYLGYEGEPLLHPNPVIDVLTIHPGFNWSGMTTVRIFDGMGRLVHDRHQMIDDGSLRVPVDELASGIYVIELASGGNLLRNRFIRE